MFIGKRVLTKHEGILKEFIVTQIFNEELELSDGVFTIIRKFWEIGLLRNEKE